MSIKYVWRIGNPITKGEFIELLTNYESFFSKLSKAFELPSFRKLIKSMQIELIVSQRYVENKWFWAWCFDNVDYTQYRWDSAYKHIYNKMDDELHTDDSFLKIDKIPTGEKKEIIAVGTSKKDYQLSHQTALIFG